MPALAIHGRLTKPIFISILALSKLASLAWFRKRDRMVEQATLTGLDLPATGTVSVKIEISAEINVSAFVARQKANRFLILQVGDQFMAGDPELVVGPRLHWRLAVQHAPSRRGTLGVVGHLLVDAETGEVVLADDQTPDDLSYRAGVLYASATP